MEDPVPKDNTELRRQALLDEYGTLNGRIEELRAAMGDVATEKADVVLELRKTGLSMVEIADRLGLTRQALYNLMEAAVARQEVVVEEAQAKAGMKPRRAKTP
jgi:lambda repressor-like predicted transcriptional regulator